jgi:putative flippase GtrA
MRIYGKPPFLNFRQFLSYLMVGGAATAVEWILFWLFVYPLKWNMNFGFILAYIISTFVNLILGRNFAFKPAVEQRNTDGSRAFLRESALVYLVAAVSCGLNVLFLNLFTGTLHMDSMMAKVVTTGLVFFFNYLARKLGIYREWNPLSNPTS